MAVALTKDDVVRAHARDELGIDIDELANPWQVGISMNSYFIGLCPPWSFEEDIYSH